MAAHMFAVAIAHFLLSCILCAVAEHGCENISISKLPVPSRDYSKRPVCVQGDELLLSRLWASVKVSLSFSKSNVHSYEADSCEALNPANRTWASAVQSMVVSSNDLDHMIFRLSPFKTSCFAVNGLAHDATWSAEFLAIDWQFPATFFAGLIIFYNAERLSRNSLFFYSSGVSLGLIMSLLLVVYILHRLVPGRGGAYAVLLGGCSVGLYLIQWTIGNLKDLLLNHNQWVIGYFVIVGAISFCVCYYYGPVTSDRGLDLIRWMLQSVGLLLLYMGTRSDEVSIALVVIVFLSHKIRSSGILLHFVRLLPHKWVSYRVYYFFFPPKHKFLSEEEYIVQGSEETRLALQDLREYCNSPECNAWRTISRLKNPTRFAKFVSTGQHYLEEEVNSYEDDPSPWLTSDEDEENHSIDG